MWQSPAMKINTFSKSRIRGNDFGRTSKTECQSPYKNKMSEANIHHLICPGRGRHLIMYAGSGGRNFGYDEIHI